MDISLGLFIAYLGLGAGVGLLSGLLGIGGGLLVVPALSILLPYSGIDTSLVMPMALATSLACIIITSSSSAYSHYRLGNFDAAVVRLLLPGVLLGGLLGSYVADILPTQYLPKVFACIVLLLAFQMAFLKPIESKKMVLKKGVTALSATIIGTISSLAGIGGGALTVPYLTYFGVPMRIAIGTASTCGVFLAISGMSGFIFFGLKQTHALPSFSAGYVYLPALLGIVLTSVFTTRIGARLASGLATHTIKRVFSIFLLLVGVSMFF